MLSLIGAIPLNGLPVPLAAIIEADSWLDHAIWFGARALGLVAFGLATASVVLGIATSTRAGDKVAGRGSIADVHRVVALLTVIALAGHILLLVLNRYMAFGPVEILVPFASSYRPIWTAAGVVAAYLLLAVFGSFYIRGLLGYRTWRALHYATFGVFVAASLHGILSGTDSGTTWARLFYAGAMSNVALAVIYRLLRGLGPRALWAWREEAGDPGLFRTVAAAAVLTVGISLAIVLPFSLTQGSSSSNTDASVAETTSQTGTTQSTNGSSGTQTARNDLVLKFAGTQAADGSWRLTATDGSGVEMDARSDGTLVLADAQSGRALYQSSNSVQISGDSGQLETLMLGTSGRRINLSAAYQRSGVQMTVAADITEG